MLLKSTMRVLGLSLHVATTHVQTHYALWQLSGGRQCCRWDDCDSMAEVFGLAQRRTMLARVNVELAVGPQDSLRTSPVRPLDWELIEVEDVDDECWGLCCHGQAVGIHLRAADVPNALHGALAATWDDRIHCRIDTAETMAVDDATYDTLVALFREMPATQAELLRVQAALWREYDLATWNMVEIMEPDRHASRQALRKF